MKILIDSNVALDSLLKRHPFYKASEKVIDLASECINVLISASAVTDIFYITCREVKNKKLAMDALKGLLQTVKVAAVDDLEIRRAISLDWEDFEDAVQFAAAEDARADCIVTRDKTGYASATIPVFEPDEFTTFFKIVKTSINPPHF